METSLEPTEHDIHSQISDGRQSSVNQVCSYEKLNRNFTQMRHGCNGSIRNLSFKRRSCNFAFDWNRNHETPLGKSDVQLSPGLISQVSCFVMSTYEIVGLIFLCVIHVPFFPFNVWLVIYCV